MILNREVYISNMDIEKIDSTHFKITIELSDGKIIAKKVNFSNATIQQREEKIFHRVEKGVHYSTAKYIYKIFLEGTCFEDEDGVAMNVTTKS